MSEKSFSLPSKYLKCIQHVQMQKQKKLINRLHKSKKQIVTHKPRDAIFSQVYVGWEQQLIKTRRVNTEAYLLSINNRNIKSDFAQKSLQLIKPRRNPILFKSTLMSNATDVNSKNISQPSYKSEQNLNFLSKPDIQNQQMKQKEEQLTTPNVKSRQSQNFKKKLTNIVENAYKRTQSNSSFQKYKSKNQNPQKSNFSRKLKLQKLKKSGQSTLKKSSDWIQIDILKLQTYFFKLFKNKFTQTNQPINQQLKQQSTIQKMPIPKKQTIPDYIRSYQPQNPQLNIQQLMQKQQFQILTDDESLYFGEISNQQRTNYGVYLCSKYRFEGMWKNDEKVYGYEINPQGCYHGRFRNNLRHGQGQFLWRNGEKFQGEWRCGVKHGSGVWKTRKGDSYIGQWNNGKVQGYGVHITSNGQRYEGYFKNYLKNGKGKQMFPNGDIFQGQYRDGKPNGKGKYTWKNKVIYEGQFVEGFRHGHGIINAQNHMKYIGQFIAQKPHGKGQIYYQNGDIFIGHFRQGQRDGQGTIKYKNLHKVVTGNWKNNRYQQQNQTLQHF